MWGSALVTWVAVLTLIHCLHIELAQSFTDCGGELIQESGIISSPLYPKQYPDNARCSWTFTAADNEVIDIRFQRLDLDGYFVNDNAQTCPDYVTVYDGNHVQAPVVATLCRSQTQEQLSSLILRSTGNTMLVTFLSDNTGQRPGFIASYWMHKCEDFMYGRDSCNVSCNCDKNNSVSCNNINGTCNCEPGWTSEDCSVDIDECVDPTVEPCPDYQDCHNNDGNFTCQCKEGLQMNTAGECQVKPEAQCTSTCRSGICVNLPVKGEVCYCPDNMMEKVKGSCEPCDNVHFGKDCRLPCPCIIDNTQSCNSDTGGCICKDGWTSDDCSEDFDECLVDPSRCQEANKVCVNSEGSYDCIDCNFHLEGDHGIVQSPNFPIFYWHGLDCSWTIKAADSDKTIALNISSFFQVYDRRNEGGYLSCTNYAPCYRDFVQIYDGNDDNAVLLGEYCHSVNHVIQSAGQYMHIVYHAVNRTGLVIDGVRRGGFNATYAQVPPSVSKDLTNPIGTIESPASPNGYYLWSITVEKESVVTFSMLDQIGTWSCDHTYLMLFDGTYRNHNNAKICGQYKPFKFTSTTNTMSVFMYTDGTFNGIKFKGKYITDGCKCHKPNTASCDSGPSGTCVCKEGFTRADCCSDINECGLDPVPCPDLSTCYNTYGSHICYCNNGIGVTSTDVCHECKTTLAAVSGNIESPGYPSNNRRYISCSWTISGQFKKVVSLRFSKFDVYGSNQCYYDAVEVYDGDSTDSPLIGRYCGTNVPELLRTTQQSRSMHIVYKTKNTNRNGFQAFYSVHDCPDRRYGLSDSCPHSCTCDFKHTERCDNINGICFCKHGWVGSGCSVDQDECRNESICPSNSECYNEPAGNYTCECLPGYIKDKKSGACQARTECGPISCSHLCDLPNDGGKPECACPPDLKLDMYNKFACRVELYPHGENNGDTVFDRCVKDAGYKKNAHGFVKTGPISLDIGFPIGDCNLVKETDVLFNGVMSLGNPDVVGNPKGQDVINQWLLAPLWTEINTQVCKVFYQLYGKCDGSDFLEDYDSAPLTVRKGILERVAKDIARVSKSDFEVTSAMIVTWQKYGPKDNITFQAVLAKGYQLENGQYDVTDNEVSYAIFIYNEGKHGWNFKKGQISQRGIPVGCKETKETEITINDESFLVNVGKLKPSEVKDNRITVISKLGGGTSGDQKCQSYLCNYVDFVKNPNYKAEIQQLFECPCSLDRLARQQWTLYEKKGSTECYTISMVAKRSFLQNNQRNKLCCYERQKQVSSSKIDVFNALQASTYIRGHILFSDPWISGQTVRQNIKAQSWCCQESSQPTKTCERFKKVFPDMGCSKNPTIREAIGFGEPHVSTVDGLTYSMNGRGEYVMMDISTKDFILQARTGRVEISPGVLSQGTVFIAFAAKESDDAHFQVELAASGLSMVILANNMDFTNAFYNNADFTWSVETLSVDRIDVGDKITVAAVFPCGVAIKVSIGIKSLDIELEVDNRLQGKTQGLLGNFNGNPNDDFKLPNGTVLPNTLSERQILEQFATAYIVTSSTSVFIYEGGETTEDYQHPEFTPLFLNEIDTSQLATARNFCGEENHACIFDYYVTKNELFASNTKTLEHATKYKREAQENSPPTLQLSRTAEINPWIVTAGTQSSLQFEATDDDGDDVTFELLESFTGLAVTPNGVLTYTASLQTPVSISVRARDSKGGYSNIVTVRVAVCPVCNNQGQCSTSEAAAQVLNKGQFMILSCQCHPAYTGVYCDSELDGCASYPCMQGQTCVDLTAAQQGDNLVGYDCGPCPAGFTQVDDICVDVDECLDENVCDQNCTNTYGSYECSCGPGYRLDLSDKTTCTDINECDEGRSGCEQNCTNTDGGFDCSCTDLYTLSTDGKACSSDFSIESPCQQCQHVCIKKNNRTSCECKLGYRVDSNDHNKCIDIDECSSTNNPCSHNCINTDGGFECSCNKGYTLDMDGLLCVECKSPYYGDNCSRACDCKGRGQCDPVRGCVCDAPWSGFSCDTRINRCEEPGACPPQFVCEEGIDSVLCLCPPGYTLDNGDCVDINECLDPGFSSSCDLNVEVCINNQGNYSCTCKHGYFRNSQGICQDIDECGKQIDGCEYQCTNGPGSFKCLCPDGYKLATDRRHCELWKDICGQNCSYGCVSDGSGGYTCVCPRGYSQTAQGTCQDVDECGSDNTNLCDYKAGCVNTDGGFTCSCQIGYKLDNDGRSCHVCSGGTWGEECANVCACGIGASHCDPAQGCVCKFGFSGERCTESVDRCASGELTCQQHEECIYSAGSSYCQCQQGFEPTSGGCQDRNECLNVRLHNCDQVCINTVGGFTCSCLEGYTYDASTNTCTDVDECQQGNSGCQHSCINVDGGYRCSCPTDLILQPDYRTCAACRETDVTTGECPSDCNCVESNTEHCNRTTRLCTCKQGWTSVDCSVDVDECLNDPCPDNRGCNNLEGSFECVCWNGLQFSSGGNCLDCNRTLTETSGRLMTSNYPQLYANNLYCTWTITVPDDEAAITLSFHDYDVEGCPYDFTEIYDGSNTKAPLLDKACNSGSLTVESTGNSMHIVFTSDTSVTDKGFRASYTSGVPCRENSCSHTCRVTSTNPWTQECFCPDWMDLDQADGQTCRDRNGCNSTITVSMGSTTSLVSPQYPGEYPTNTYCNWTIQGEPGRLVTLSFSAFALEVTADCSFDYLEVHDGYSASAPVIGDRLCGNDIPSTITSTGPVMFIIFRSDASLTDSGFNGQLEIISGRSPAAAYDLSSNWGK